MPKRIKELFEKRNQNERHFLLDDGSYEVVVKAQQCYKKQNKFELTEDFILTSDGVTTDNFKFNFNKHKIKYNNNIELDIEGLYLDDQLISLPNSNVVPIIKNNSIIWENIFNNIDLIIYLSPFNSIEQIVLKKNPLTGLNLSGSTLWIKFKKQGADLNLQPPLALDANNKFLSVLIEQNNKEIKKGINIIDLYNVKYPILLDPTTTISGSNIQDYYSNGLTGGPNYAYLQGIYVTTDYKNNTYTSASYISFNLASLSSATVSSATGSIYVTNPEITTKDGLILSAVSANNETNISSLLQGGEEGLNSVIIGSPTIQNLSLGASFTGYKHIDVTSHVQSHIGGKCDFGLYNNSAIQFTYYGINYHAGDTTDPYLTIIYTAGESTAQANPCFFGAGI